MKENRTENQTEDLTENQTMKGLPEMERPYEKCMQNGAKSLSDAELLAAILGTGTQGKSALGLAREMLYKESEGNGILGLLQLEEEKLLSIPGIGKSKAARFLCIFEFARRISKEKAKCRLDFSNPRSVADYYMEDMRHLKQEQLLLIMLNGKNKLIRDKVLFKGTVNQSLANPREVFLEALKAEAVFIILLHNHPSGDTSPSKADLFMTRQIKEAGELIGIRLLDHIIIGDKSYTSLCNERLL